MGLLNKDTKSPAGAPASVTIQADGKRWRTIQDDAHRAAENSGQAVSMLSEMMEPTEGENTQLAEVTQLLTAIVERLAQMDARLRAIESRLPGPGGVSRG